MIRRWQVVLALLVAGAWWGPGVLPSDGANGDVIEVRSISGGGTTLHVKLLDAQSAAGNGVWIDVRDWPGRGSIEVSAIEAAGVVQLMASSAATKPTDATDGTKIGSDITTAGFTAVDLTCRWIKAKKSAADATPGNRLATVVVLIKSSLP